MGSLEAPVEILTGKRERKKSRKFQLLENMPANTAKKTVDTPQG